MQFSFYRIVFTVERQWSSRRHGGVSQQFKCWKKKTKMWERMSTNERKTAKQWHFTFLQYVTLVFYWLLPVFQFALLWNEKICAKRENQCEMWNKERAGQPAAMQKYWALGRVKKRWQAAEKWKKAIPGIMLQHVTGIMWNWVWKFNHY